MKWLLCGRRKGVTVLMGLLATVATAYGIMAQMAQPANKHPWFPPNARRPLVIAHQGGDGIRPSNTMVAFQHAVALGADVLDADIHISKDGVIVVMHDETVDRTTNGTGFIRDKTLAELKALDAGYKWTGRLDYKGDVFPFRGQGIAVPTLEELFAAFPEKLHNLEIKQTPPAIAEPLCALIRKHNLQHRVMVSSFRPENTYAFRRACPEVATGAVEPEVRELFMLDKVASSRLHSPKYHTLQIPEFGGGFHLLTPGMVAAAHARGVEVHPWTINEIDDMRRMIALGVDGINTDYPDRLIALLGR